MGPSDPAGGFWTVRGIGCPARLSKSEAGHWAPRWYMYASGMGGISVLLSRSMLWKGKGDKGLDEKREVL